MINSNFHQWLSSIVGRNESEIEKLLDAKTDVHFLITLSIFEGRCFNGYMQIPDIEPRTKYFIENGNYSGVVLAPSPLGGGWLYGCFSKKPSPHPFLSPKWKDEKPRPSDLISHKPEGVGPEISQSTFFLIALYAIVASARGQFAMINRPPETCVAYPSQTCPRRAKISMVQPYCGGLNA